MRAIQSIANDCLGGVTSVGTFMANKAVSMQMSSMRFNRTPLAVGIVTTVAILSGFGFSFASTNPIGASLPAHADGLHATSQTAGRSQLGHWLLSGDGRVAGYGCRLGQCHRHPRRLVWQRDAGLCLRLCRDRCNTRRWGLLDIKRAFLSPIRWFRHWVRRRRTQRRYFPTRHFAARRWSGIDR